MQTGTSAVARIAAKTSRVTLRLVKWWAGIVELPPGSGNLAAHDTVAEGNYGYFSPVPQLARRRRTSAATTASPTVNITISLGSGTAATADDPSTFTRQKVPFWSLRLMS